MRIIKIKFQFPSKQSVQTIIASYKRSKSQAGLTLVELLIYMGLLTVFVGVMTELFTSSIAAKLESEATASVDQDGRYLYLKLQHDISRADTILFPVFSGAPEEEMIIQIDGQSFEYYLSPEGNLMLYDGTNAYQLNSGRSSVSNLVIERIGNALDKDTVRIEYTVTSIMQKTNGPEERTFHTTIGLR